MTAPILNAPPKLLKGVQFYTDFTDDSDIYASGGDFIAKNHGSVDLAPRLRGDITTGQLLDGLRCVKWHNYGTADNSTYSLAAANLTRGNYVFPILSLTFPQDRWYGYAVWIPSSLSIPVGWGQPVWTKLIELHFQNIGGSGSPLSLILYNDHIKFQPCGGAWDGANYDYSQGRGNIPSPLYAIPPGQFVYNAWNMITFHVHWATDTTGAAEFFYRAKGATTWNVGSTVSGIPTATWLAGGAPGGYYMDNLLNYSYALTADFDLYTTRYTISADSMDKVRALMP